MNISRLPTRITALLLCLLLSAGAASAITIPEEKKLAREFMKMIRKQDIIIRDPISNHLVTGIGELILSTLPPQPFEYNFFLIDDPSFNAFASPAANIFINRGLITSLDTADELAGIIGHEIAHAESRHVSESIDRSKYINLATLAGALAGILIGGSSGGQVATVWSSAIGWSSILAFTRRNETEADEKGVLLLEKSCFSPAGLLSGLQKIRAADWQGIDAIPDYFKTHPGTSQRISHLGTLLHGSSAPAGRKDCGVDFRFDMVKYRMIGLYEPVEKGSKHLSSRLSRDPDNPAVHYGAALNYIRQSRRKEALFHLEKALAANYFDPLILLETGRVYLLDGKAGKAAAILEGLAGDPVVGLMSVYYAGIAHLEMGMKARAQTELERVIKTDPLLYPEAYHYLARIHSTGNQGLSHYYLGVYYHRIKDRRNAVHHLEKAIATLKDAKKIETAETLLEGASGGGA